MSDETSSRQLSDPQDPLPESNWLWRRVFIFGLSMAVLYLVFTSVDRLGTVAVVKPDIGIPAFVNIVKLLVFTLNFVILCYMVAPSAEQITKLVKTASLLKAGVQIASRATVQTPERKEETQATVGLPPQPVVPPESAPGEPPNVGSGASTLEDRNRVPGAPGEAQQASEATSDDEDYAPTGKTNG